MLHLRRRCNCYRLIAHGFALVPNKCFCHAQHSAVPRAAFKSHLTARRNAGGRELQPRLSRVAARDLLRKRRHLSAARPAPCRSAADLYGDQEQHKCCALPPVGGSGTRARPRGKTFARPRAARTGWFDRKHADTLAADGFCLGDLCDVLDCAAAPRLARTRPSYYDDDDGARDDDGYRGARRRRRYDDDGDDDRPGRAAVAPALSALATPCDADSAGGRRARCKAALAAIIAGGRGRRARLATRCVNGRVLVAPTVDQGRAPRGGGRAGRGHRSALPLRRLPRRLLRPRLLATRRLVDRRIAATPVSAAARLGRGGGSEFWADVSCQRPVTPCGESRGQIATRCPRSETARVS